MKRLLAALLCVLFVLTGGVCAFAEDGDSTTQTTTEPFGDQTTTEPSGDETTTEPSDDQTTTEPSEDVTTTEPSEDVTTTDQQTRINTSVIISYDTARIQVTVYAATGAPVAGAPVSVSVDGTEYLLTTDESGVAVVAVSGDFREVVANMGEYQAGDVIYAASAASVLRQQGGVDIPMGSDMTTLPTTVPATAPQRPSFSGATFTTTDPEQNTTATEMTTTTAAPTTETSGEQKEQGSTRRIALLFILLGGVFFAVAALVAYFMLIRQRKTDLDEPEPEELEGAEILEEEAADIPTEADEAVPLFEEPEELLEEIDEAEEKTPIIGEKTISLEDLFGDK